MKADWLLARGFDVHSVTLTNDGKVMQMFTDLTKLFGPYSNSSLC